MWCHQNVLLRQHAQHVTADASIRTGHRNLASQQCGVRTCARAHTSSASPSSVPDTFVSERGVQCVTGHAFYRAESAQGRDLAVLIARLHKRKCGALKVLDVMSGSGIRGARYLQQADADAVWCNDYNSSLHSQIVYNLNYHMRESIQQSQELEDDAASSSTKQHEIHDIVEVLERPAQKHVPVGSKRPVWQWAHNFQSSSVQSTSTSHSDSGQLETHKGPAHSDSLHAQSSQHSQDSRQPQFESFQETNEGDGAASWRLRVSHMDAKRLLTACYLAEDYYDLIDIDSFGSESDFLGNAIEAVKFGGLLYLTSTDGFSSGGRRPHRSLAAYGCYTRSLPWSNEQGLRMLIGTAVKEGATRGVSLTPVFSLYSYHGPVFRVMLRAKRSAEWSVQHYSFAGHCHVHGHTRTVDWTDLGDAACRCLPRDSVENAPALSVAGPMWTGPLHSQQDIQDMIDEANSLGWSGHSSDAGAGAIRMSKKSNTGRPLQDMLQIMLEESDARLPPGFIMVDTLGKYCTSYPSRDKLIAELKSRGFAAARCHLENKAFRTNAKMQDIVSAAVAVGVQRRMDCPWPA